MIDLIGEANMGPRTKIGKVPIFVKGNVLSTIRDVFKQLKFVGLIELLNQSSRVLHRELHALKAMILLDNLFHLL